MRSWTIPISLAAVLAAAAGSCGPSLRRTYQSDNAFARCFDMDYNPGASLGEKERCWNEWLAEHVYNQPEDKIAYARLRLDEIGRGVSVPGPPGPPGAFDQRPVPAASRRAPEAETDAGVAPDAGAAADAGTVREAGLPEGECQGRCEESWRACGAACGQGVSNCAGACEAGYRACMKGCFGD